MTAELLVDDKTFLRRREGDYELSVDNSTSLICVMKSGGHGGGEREREEGRKGVGWRRCAWRFAAGGFLLDNKIMGRVYTRVIWKIFGILILISFYNCL